MLSILLISAGWWKLKRIWPICRISRITGFASCVVDDDPWLFYNRGAAKYHGLQGMTTEVGIYKRKQERKKARKQELDQESDQGKKKVFSFFLVEFLFSCFLDRFLGRVLVFFYKFPPLCDPNTQTRIKCGSCLLLLGL